MLKKINCALYIAFLSTVFTVYLKMAKYCLINWPDWSVFYFCKLWLQQVRVKATGSKTWRERKEEWVWRLNTLTALDIQPTSQQKRFTGLGNWQMSYSTKQRNEVKWMGQLRVKQKLGKCRLSLFHSFYTGTSQFMSFELIKHVYWTFFVLFHLFPASRFMILYTADSWTQNEMEWKWKFT